MGASPCAASSPTEMQVKPHDSNCGSLFGTEETASSYFYLILHPLGLKVPHLPDKNAAPQGQSLQEQPHSRWEKVHHEGGDISGASGCAPPPALAPQEPGLSPLPRDPPPALALAPAAQHAPAEPGAGCRLAASSSLSPATAKPARNILMENTPLAQKASEEDAAAAGIPRRLPSGYLEGTRGSLGDP